MVATANITPYRRAGQPLDAESYPRYLDTELRKLETTTNALAAYGGTGAARVFSAAPAVPIEGMLVAYTDSTTAVWRATITGGGANHVLGYFNGTNWTVAG